MDSKTSEKNPIMKEGPLRYLGTIYKILKVNLRIFCIWIRIDLKTKL